tara:strand:+ start:431 stop:601 length:171 start_codon:yes stop_codon:yes gene_type:complete
MTNLTMIKYMLYGALGATLAASGVGLLTKPVQFLAIVAIVIGIDCVVARGNSGVEE